MGNGDGWGDARQLPAEIRERLREAQDLRREWGTTGNGSGKLDEVIDDLHMVVRGFADQAMDVINLKISKVGGLTKARQIRDLCVGLGIAM